MVAVPSCRLAALAKGPRRTSTRGHRAAQMQEMQKRWRTDTRRRQIVAEERRKRTECMIDLQATSAQVFTACVVYQ